MHEDVANLSFTSEHNLYTIDLIFTKYVFAFLVTLNACGLLYVLFWMNLGNTDWKIQSSALLQFGEFQHNLQPDSRNLEHKRFFCYTRFRLILSRMQDSSPCIKFFISYRVHMCWPNILRWPNYQFQPVYAYWGATFH